MNKRLMSKVMVGYHYRIMLMVVRFGMLAAGMMMYSITVMVIIMLMYIN